MNNIVDRLNKQLIPPNSLAYHDDMVELRKDAVEYILILEAKIGQLRKRLAVQTSDTARLLRSV